MSPATTSPLSRTRSRTSTSPVDRPCPSVNDVGIGPVFYEVSSRDRFLTWRAEGRAYLSNGDASFDRPIEDGTNILCIEAQQQRLSDRTRSLQRKQLVEG